MLGCLLFKKIKTFNESCSLSKATRMSSTYKKFRRTHGYSINLIIKLTVKNKMSL